MQIINKISELREVVKGWEKEGLTVGLVPTMGALHNGHKSLIKKSTETCDKTVVSVFVNPTQFGINEDFSKYPRTLDSDKIVCEEVGADIIFAPSAEEMYPNTKSLKDLDLTYVCPPFSFVDNLCGKSRVGHFDGVALVVSKLFNIVTPDYAFFGQKDAQQFIIIKKMVNDLSFDIKLVQCPIVRDENGLALSSRNKYLSEEEYNKALTINKALKNVETLYNEGVKDTKKLFDFSLPILDKDVNLEYFEFLDYETFEKSDIINEKVLVAIAVRVGTTRLIDNIILGN